MPHFTAFDNLDGLFKAMEVQRKAADSRVKPFQKDIKPGNFYLQLVEDMAIYGEVLPDPSEVSPEEEPLMPNYRFVRGFSVCCPEGELGETHVSSMDAPISKAQFEAAKAQGWPCDPEAIKALLQLGSPQKA